MENKVLFWVMSFVVLIYTTDVGADQNMDLDSLIYDDWNIVLNDYMSCEEVDKGNYKAYMVSTTDQKGSIAYKKCEKPSYADIYEMIPVYSEAVNLHFKNKFCSKFVEGYNFYTDSRRIYDTLIYWSVVVELKCFLRKVSRLSQQVPYNTFLSKSFGQKSECDINIYPPFQYDVMGGFYGSNCTQNLKSLCQTIRNAKSNNESTYCSTCSWIMQENVCLDHRYIKSTQLQTYIRLQPPSDHVYIHESCINKEWMSDTTRQNCIDPVHSASGLLTDFWIKLIKWGKDAEIDDNTIIDSLEKELKIGDSMLIRFVERNEETDDEKDDTDTNFEDVTVMDRILQCRRMYMAILVAHFMPIEEVKESVKRIKTILQTSNAFVVDEYVTIHFALHEPTCFEKKSSSVSELSSKSREDDSQYLDDFLKRMIALAVGFIIPVVFAVFRVCLFMIQNCSIQVLDE